MRLAFRSQAPWLPGLLSILIWSCVNEFQPSTRGHSPALVVEGEITDQPGPYVVKLTRTADYSYKSVNLLETGATVTISNSAGETETLVENTGTYSTRANGIRGKVGRSYRLMIRTKDGKTYQSDQEVLPAAPPIQKVYYEFRNELIPGTAVRKIGWDAYVDTKDPDTLGNYYRWTWTHYEPVAACLVTFSNNQYIGRDCCSPCWDITRCYDCININSDANINGQAISRQLITRVPYTSSSRYYLEVQQQALSRGAYTFFKSVKQLTQNTGGIFDAAPATPRGNVHCTSDPAEVVYGYFGAIGVAEQYIWVERTTDQGAPDLLPPINIPQPSLCYPCINSSFRTPNKPQWWTN